MPELPEVETVVRGLSSTLTGESLSSIVFFRDKIRDEIPKDLFLKFFQGQQIRGVFRRGKYIVLQSDLGFGLIHLGMSGVLVLESQSAPLPKHTHFMANISSTSERLRFTDPRRFGRLGAVKKLEDSPWLSDLGAEPLEQENLGRYLGEIAKNRKIPIKSFIMDSKIVVGVGNIYAAESLFRASISPLRSADSLSRSEWLRLAKAIQWVLKKAILAGGTTLKDFRTSGGERGYFVNDLKVYGRKDPCVKCGNTILQIRQSGRSTWYCPRCQQ
jgi:formamidopyrimidine-DNA glycosylase